MIKYQDSLNVQNCMRLQIHIALLKTNKDIDTTLKFSTKVIHLQIQNHYYFSYHMRHEFEFRTCDQCSEHT
jgi:hypothetical protein